MNRRSSSSLGPPRLQKVLATAGYGSRRQCEELIVEGRVEIDRETVTELGTRVDSASQQVRVDGVVVKLPRIKYFMLHKPPGVVCTARDPWARLRVLDLVDDPDRLFTVGRLDRSSTGLILVTNDGDLANRLAHPRFGVEKTYRVLVHGQPDRDTLAQLRRGVYLSEGKVSVKRLTVKSSSPRGSWLEIVLDEGRNREIRRILARVGHKVLQLKRIAIGRLRLGDLPEGAYRELTHQEVQRLQAGPSTATKRQRPQRSKTRATGRKGSGRQSDAQARPRPTSPKRQPAQGTVLSDQGDAERRPKRKTASNRHSIAKRKSR